MNESKEGGSISFLLCSMKMPARFPGQYHMARQTAKYFPTHYSVYVEPFAGKANNAKHCKVDQKHMYLNDLASWSVAYCRSLYPHANITSHDYSIVINKHKTNPHAFLVIDPPWCSMPCYVITESPITNYYTNTLALLKGAKCKWMLLGSTKWGYTHKFLTALHHTHPNIVLWSDTGASFHGSTVGVRFIRNYSD